MLFNQRVSDRHDNDLPLAKPKQTPSIQNQNQTHIEEVKDTKVSKNNRASSLNDEWVLPEDYRQWVKDENICHDDNFINRVAADFKDHWLGNGETKKNWKAVWRKWCRSKYTTWPQSKNPKLTERAEDFDESWGDKPEEGDLFNVV